MFGADLGVLNEVKVCAPYSNGRVSADREKRRGRVNMGTGIATAQEGGGRGQSIRLSTDIKDNDHQVAGPCSLGQL